ncbi:MAG: hypothetical protein R3B06_23495 [Kofleriaceae bacterium]
MNRSKIYSSLSLAALGVTVALSSACTEDAGPATPQTTAAARVDDGARGGRHPGPAVDTDGDGVVSDAERAAARAAHVDQLFARLDADGDGALTAAELAAGPTRKRGPGLDLARLDADGDGQVTKAELLAAGPPPEHRGRDHRRHGPPAEVLAAFDADHDGTLSTTERAAAHAARVADLLARLDADHDGKLSAAELAAEAGRGHRRGPAFATLDVDGDGFVTAAELTQARPPGRDGRGPDDGASGGSDDGDVD